jgi:hypothetical protein
LNPLNATWANIGFFVDSRGGLQAAAGETDDLTFQKRSYYSTGSYIGVSVNQTSVFNSITMNTVNLKPEIARSLQDDVNNSVFAGTDQRIYLETPVANVWLYYSNFLLRNAYSSNVRMWIEFDLALLGGKRDYIWQQFNHICASVYKEGDFPKITNFMILCDACDNKGFGNVKNFLLYNCYNGEERFFWQKFVKKTLAKFLITLSPLATSDRYDSLNYRPKVWDFNLNRYFTIYWK